MSQCHCHALLGLNLCCVASYVDVDIIQVDMDFIFLPMPLGVLVVGGKRSCFLKL